MATSFIYHALGLQGYEYARILHPFGQREENLPKALFESTNLTP
jgi:hypothetical protein